MPNGSYVISALGGKNSSEVDRLKKQASVFQGIETQILKGTGICQSSRIIELGCGPGFITPLLMKLAPSATFLAIDYSWDLLSQFQKNSQSADNNNLFPMLSSAGMLAVKSDWGDFAYCRFLLQHVPSAEAVIKEAYRALRPGGTLCIIDSDDGLVINYPSDPRIHSVLHNAQKEQKKKGGDRFIGRKISVLLAEAGFEKINAQIQMITDTQIPFKAFFGILFGYKATLGQSSEITPELETDLEQACASGQASLAAGVYIVTGKKPAK